LAPYTTSAVIALVWQTYGLLVNLSNFRLVLANSSNPLSRSVWSSYFLPTSHFTKKWQLLGPLPTKWCMKQQIHKIY